MSKALVIPAILAVVIGLTSISKADGPPEMPSPQRVVLKDGRRVEVDLQRFGSERFHLYMFGDKAFANNERFHLLQADQRRILQWAAEDDGIQGDLELHLKSSLDGPVASRLIRSQPMVLDVAYVKGKDVQNGRPITIPICCVAPISRQAFIAAANKLREYNAYLDREDEKLRAARATARAAQQAAWAAQQAADNTREMLDLAEEARGD